MGIKNEFIYLELCTLIEEGTQKYERSIWETQKQQNPQCPYKKIEKF